MDQAPAQEIASQKERKCEGVDCSNDAGTLQCPTCQKLGKESYFCSQDCFKRSWSTHKALHKAQNNGHFNPFPTFPYTGSLRPVYPLSPRRPVPERIRHPEYHQTGVPKSASIVGRNKSKILTKEEQAGMRKVCRLAREVLDIAAREVKVGVTTDHIDKVVHDACIERNSYPSTLNYWHYPKSLCTSVNEVICHGIPDHRPLQDGDIINLDVTLYHGGFHGDLNATYYVGSASSNPDTVRVVEAARDCLDAAIKMVKPGVPIREFGNTIEKLAKERKCQVVRTYCGHGINETFHCPPNVPHYAKNKAIGECKPGMTFTIEPMITLGSYRDKTWPDNWTSVTVDGMKTAQFEHTLLVTEDGVEVLTAELEDSPGGKVVLPVEGEGETNGHAGGEANGKA